MNFMFHFHLCLYTSGESVFTLFIVIKSFFALRTIATTTTALEEESGNDNNEKNMVTINLKSTPRGSDDDFYHEVLPNEI